ncbi:MAG: EAL domain-containing protein [Marinobacterium sp.]|nr:EAL domain-containing protein [Marinobacterium sp.]
MLIKQRRATAGFLFALLLFVLALGACYVERLNQSRITTEQRAVVQKHLFRLREQLEMQLVKDLQLVRGLVASVALQPEMTAADFARIGTVLFTHDNHLRNIAAAPDMVISLIYPLEGNRRAIGLDYRNVPAQFEAVERARISGSSVLAGPLKLVQGGTGLLVRMPVYLTRPGENSEYFWGIISAVIDDQRLFKSSGLMDADLPVEIAIRGRDGLGERGDVFLGRAELFNEQAIVTEILLPGGYWQLAASARSEFTIAEPYTFLFRLGYGLFSLVVLLAFGLMARSLHAASIAQRQAETSQALLTQSMDTLHEREQLLRTVIDEMPDIVLVKDSNADFLLSNAALARLYNTTPQAMVGKYDADFGVPSELAESMRQNVLDVIASGETEIVFEDSQDSVTGEVRHFKSIKKPFKGAHGDSQLLVIAHDITDIVRARKRLEESEQRFKIAGMAAYDLVYEWSIDDDSLRWFGDIDRMLGYEAGTFSESIDRWLTFIHPDDLPAVKARSHLYRQSVDGVQQEYRMRHCDGSYRYWSDRALPLMDDDGQALRWVGVCTDITDQKEQQAQLEYAAYHDMLTQLPNRVMLSERLRQLMQHEGDAPVEMALVYIDLDGFKEINDLHGHEMGDHFLIAISRRFRKLLRPGDMIARLGGDEFVAVFMHTTTSDELEPLLQGVLQQIAQPVRLDEAILQVSASLGVTFYPQVEDIDEDQLLRQADQAMYQAKLSGKNGYHVFDTEQDRTIRDQREMLERIATALAEREFVLYYQPKVNMRTGELVGVEALIRWQHPECGMVPPGEFLPVIENHPLSLELGRWVISEALRQMTCWQREGLEISVSVNICCMQLQQTDFVEQLQQMLAVHPEIAPQRLELEVLETSALEDLQQVSRIMTECQRIGVSFALDDFGTGYSSLAYLKHLPAAVMKIDRSFIRDMLVDPDDRAILEGVIGMAAAFRRQVIAEGVEDIEQGELLLQQGCELAQGFGIARPMPAAELPGWLHNWQPPLAWRHAGQTETA